MKCAIKLMQLKSKRDFKMNTAKMCPELQLFFAPEDVKAS